MSLYQEIILLKTFAKPNTKWIIENVIPYYVPLIPPDKKLHRHYYWCNFKIDNFIVNDNRKHEKIKGLDGLYGFDLSNTKIKDKRKALRNMVDPELGKHILDCAIEVKSYKQLGLFNELFNPHPSIV
jgi:DNA (cytosine-5)-methyltransferase 1